MEGRASTMTGQDQSEHALVGSHHAECGWWEDVNIFVMQCI